MTSPSTLRCGGWHTNGWRGCRSAPCARNPCGSDFSRDAFALMQHQDKGIATEVAPTGFSRTGSAYAYLAGAGCRCPHWEQTRASREP